MMPAFAIILDMDGVIVDTVTSLYQGYLAILSRYGIIGNRSEFNELNGPSLDEITHILSSRYTQIDSEEKLKQQFITLHKTLYQDASLCHGVIDFLQFCKDQHIPVALASSSNRANIKVIFDRFSLHTFFSHIVSGDDVQQAKPHPEIYQLAAAPFEHKVIFSLDDSPKGVESSLQAGLISVQYCQDTPLINVHGADKVSSFNEFRQLITQPITWFNRYSQYTFAISEFDFTPFNEAIDVYWQTHKQKSMFNGAAVLCSGLSANVVKVTQCDYKTVFYIQNNRDSQLAKHFFLFGVSGYVIKDQAILIAQRSEVVSQYPGYIECPPSGGFEKELGIEAYQQQLLKEFQEETAHPLEHVEEVITQGIILDLDANQLDILSAIKLSDSAECIYKDNSEYQSLNLINIHSFKKIIQTDRVLPECYIIAKLLGEKNENWS